MRTVRESLANPLWRLWGCGAAVAATFFAAAWCWPDDAAAIQRRWHPPAAWLLYEAHESRCTQQFRKRQNERTKRFAALHVSDQRLHRLRTVEASGDERIVLSPTYAQLREEYERESAQRNKLRARAHELDIDRSVRDPLATVLVAAGILAPLAIALKIGRDARLKLGMSSAQLAANWRPLTLVFVSIQWLFHVAGELGSSVLRTEKTWFGSDSWCVSPARFLLVLVMVLGTQICISCPLIVVWNSSSDEHVPPIDLEDRHGRVGVGVYLDVFQRWVLLSLAATAMAVLGWMLLASRTSDFRFYALRLTPSLGILAALYVRYANRVLDVRRKYYDARAGSGATWTEIAARKLPADPTTRFVGANVWSLGPATLGLFAVVWTIIKALGLDVKLLP